MIVDTVDGLSKYASLHRFIVAAAEFLAQPGLQELPDGHHEIQGNELFALVMWAYGKHMDEAKLEVHSEYVDVQVLLEGTESIGWKTRSTCVLPVSPTNRRKTSSSSMTPPTASCALAKASSRSSSRKMPMPPMIAPGMLHKVVIKMAV